MENASKALIMAGGILISILILALGVYLWANISSIADTYNLKTTSEQVNKFNSNFTVFIGRQDITAQEVVSLKNFVDEQSRKIDIQGIDIKDTTDFLKNNSYYTEGENTGKIKYFKCEGVTYSKTTALVNSITFSEV